MGVTVRSRRPPKRPRAEWHLLFRLMRDRGEKVATIARTYGVGHSFVSSVLNDPDGSKERERKNKYRRPCPECGKPMDGSNGNGPHASRYCSDCIGAAMKVWTAEAVIEAIQGWAAEYGRPPTATDWFHAGVTPGGVRYPAATSTFSGANGNTNSSAPFVYWADAIEAAGFPRPRIGGYVRTEETRAKYRESLAGRQRLTSEQLLADLRELATRLGRVPLVKQDIGEARSTTLRARFGSVAEAYRLVGLPPPERGSRAHRRAPLPPGWGQ